MNFSVIDKIGLPPRGRPIFLVTRMITDRIGIHSLLLLILIALTVEDRPPLPLNDLEC